MRPNRMISIVILLALAAGGCNPTPTPTSAPAPLAATPSAPAAQPEHPPAATPAGMSANAPTAALAQPAANAQSALEKTLALRSVRMTLQSTLLHGGARSAQAEIDASGNYHLAQQGNGNLPEGFSIAAEMPAGTEVWVIAGQAYGRTAQGEMTVSETQELAGALKALLAGYQGPGLWLRVLPKGSLAAQGAQSAETRGGFETIKYAVNGQIEAATITGAIWVDKASGALVAADLNVPGALASDPRKPEPGALKIVFSVEKAAVAPIQAANLAKPSAAETANPSLAGSAAVRPVVRNRYLIDPQWVSGLNLIVVNHAIWVLTATGDLVVYDPATGAEQRAVRLHPAQQLSNLSLFMFGRLAYDGHSLWALLYKTPTGETERELFRVDPQSGSYTTVKLPLEDATCFGSCAWHDLGISPGKLWVSGEGTIWVFDSNDPSQVIKIPETESVGYLAADKDGVMWGSVQSEHGFLTRIDLEHLDDIITIDCVSCSWVLPLDGRVWAGVSTPPYQVIAFEADGFSYASAPIIETEVPSEIGNEITGVHVFFDGRYIWDKAFLEDNLFLYDPQDGHLVTGLSIYTQPGAPWNQRDTIMGMDTDGQSVWLVARQNSTPELVQVELK